MSRRPSTSVAFTRPQIYAIALLSFLQFTIILDFMILSPLGAILLQELNIRTAQFGFAVSAYAIAAGASGIVAAGFADRFDRKRLLLFFYTGFVLGTFLCGLAPNYPLLLLGRILTGLFGGVIGAISIAIVADLFSLEVRGRVMGFIQTAFAASQVLGLPLGVYLANHFGWHSAFLFIAAVALVVGFVIAAKLPRVDAHLTQGHRASPFQHLWRTATNRRYQVGFAATVLLATGGFMLMPFGSTFSVENLKIAFDQLPMIYLITGICSLIAGPLIGRASDRYGKYLIFCVGTFVGLGIVLYYTRLGPTPIATVILLNVVLFASISGRMVSSGALNSAVPEPTDRGAYMAINTSLQQIAGGVAAWVAGRVVVQSPNGHLEHYPVLGYIVAATMAISMVLMGRVNRMVAAKRQGARPPANDVAQHAA